MAALPKYKNKPGVPKKEKKPPFKFDRGPGTKKRKKEKKYETGISDKLARTKKAMTSDKAYALPFGETFRAAKKAGKDKFRWKGKSYCTIKSSTCNFRNFHSLVGVVWFQWWITTCNGNQK